jgi:hypothetical protein
MKPFYLLIVILVLQVTGFTQNVFDLKLNLAKGDSFIIDYSVTSNTDQEIMGVQQNIISRENLRYLFTVTDRLDEGSFTFQMTCKKYRSTVQTSETFQTFDSDSMDLNPGSEYIKLFLEKPIYVKMNTRGRILSFDASKIEMNTDSITDPNELFLENARHKFGDQFPKAILSLMKCPSDKVKPGQTWSSPDTVFLYPYFYDKIESTLIEVKDGAYNVNQTGKISSDEQKFYKTNRIFISYQLSGNMVNTMSLDQNNGMFTEVKMIQNITGNAGMKYSENSDTEYQWPIQIKNDIVLKSTKL